MSKQLQAITIAAPGFYGLNTQDSGVTLDNGFALQADNCVIDKFGRIGARKGWAKVNTSAISSTPSVRALFEFVKADGNVLFSAAGNKIYAGTTTLTEQRVDGVNYHTGTYSQTGTTITVSIPSHGYSVGNVVNLYFTSGTATDGVYTVVTVPSSGTFTVTAAVSTSTSGNINCINVISYTITDDNWQITSMPYGTGLTSSAHAMFVQSGHIPLVYHKLGTASHTHSDGYGFQRLGDIGNVPSGYSTSTFKPSCALTAYGRLWVAGPDSSDVQTVYFSDLQNPAEWLSGTSGLLDISTVIPTGDPITALASHNGYLVIFCKNHIVIYSNATDPANLTLVDVISGVGCIARDSVQSVAGTDLLFLSATGVQSFQRVIQEKSLPFRDVSKNVRDDLLSNVASETLAYIKAVYYPTDAIYLLSLPTTGVTYCFDTRGTLQNGSARTTTWTSINPTAFCVTDARQLYIGKQGYIGNYTGNLDNGSNYRMSYYTNYLDFQAATNIKVLKKIILTAIGGSGQELSVKWGYDYSENYTSDTIIFGAQSVSYYGVSEYNIAEYSDGITISNTHINGSGYGSVLQLGFEVEINGASLSIQKIDVFVKAGRMI